MNQQMNALEKEYTERIEKIHLTLDNCEKKRESESKKFKTDELSYKKLISEKDNVRSYHVVNISPSSLLSE